MPEVTVTPAEPTPVAVVEKSPAPPKDAPAAAPATPPAPDAAPPAPDAATPPAEPEEDPKAAKVAARFAEIARRESALTKREQSLKAQEQELRAYHQAREAAKANPRDALKALGLTLKDLVDYELKDGQPETVESRLERLERERKEEAEARKKQDEEASQRKVEETFNAVRANIRKLVESAPDKYELIATEGAHEEVFLLIDGMYAATHAEAQAGKRKAPVLLTIEQAADMIEAELLERAKKLAGAKKLAPPPPAAEPTPAAPATPTKQKTRTLTTERIATPPGVQPAEPKLTRKERLERAAARLRFT